NDAVLDLDEVAQMHAGAEHGARTGAGVGPDHAGLAHGGAVDVAEGLDAGAGADAGVADHAVGADAHAVAELDLAFEDAIDVDLDVAAHGERTAHVDARRIDQRDALFHQAAGDVALVDALELRQLQLVVDAERLGKGVGLHGGDLDAVSHGQADDVGEVVLALGVVVADAPEPVAQLGNRGDQDAGVHFLHLALFVGGVLLLDDA